MPEAKHAVLGKLDDELKLLKPYRPLDLGLEDVRNPGLLIVVEKENRRTAGNAHLTIVPQIPRNRPEP
jgi:hypothetical protein